MVIKTTQYIEHEGKLSPFSTHYFKFDETCLGIRFYEEQFAKTLKGFYYMSFNNTASYEKSIGFSFESFEDATKLVEDIIETDEAGQVTIYDIEARAKALGIKLVRNYLYFEK